MNKKSIFGESFINLCIEEKTIIDEIDKCDNIIKTNRKAIEHIKKFNSSSCLYEIEIFNDNINDAVDIKYKLLNSLSDVRSRMSEYMKNVLKV